MRRAVARWHVDVLRRAADEIAGIGHAVAPRAEDEAALARVLYARIIAAAERIGRLTLVDIGHKSTLADIETKRIPLFDALRVALDWARRQAADKAKRITETVRRLLRREVVRGLREGDGNAAIARNIREAAPEVGRRRADTIARTETHNAAQRGAYEVAKSSGLDLVKEWVSVEDKRTRPDHAEADGQVREADGFFAVGGEALRFPGDPNGSAKQVINCRCVASWLPRVAVEPERIG